MMFPKDYNFTNSIQSTATATNSQHKVGRSFKFDYKTHRFVFEDGRNVEDTQIEAIKQWIELFIRTEMKKYLIYSDSFGLDLTKLLGYRLPRAYKVSEIKKNNRRYHEQSTMCCSCQRLAIQRWYFISQ